jgi:HEPN domain-containing protein
MDKRKILNQRRENMVDRSKDWFAQAERDLDHAKSSQTEGRHEWACFAAQQSAEKATKALHLSLKQEAWGHVVARLLAELPISVPEDLTEKAKVLDGFYIPTRYANGHPEGAPFEHYGIIQSQDAIRYASEILEFVRIQMAAKRDSGSGGKGVVD